MQINGYKIRAAIKKLTRKRDVLQSKFVKNTTYFASRGEMPKLVEIGSDLDVVETQLVALQIIQLRYNLAVFVTVKGYEQMSLAAAVKQAGTRIRMATTWRKVAGEKPDASRYAYASETIQRDVEYAVAAVPADEALRLESHYNDIHTAFQQAIAEANATTIDLDVHGLEKLLA